MAEPIKLDGDLTFTPEQIQEITGMEKVENLDQVKEFFEELKNKPPEVKEKDYEFKDDYIRNLVNYYTEHGDVKPYVENNVDYSTYTPEQLIEMRVREENSRLPKEAQDIMVKRELAKYEVEEDAGEDDKTLKAALKEQSASEYREALEKKQQQFKAPETTSVDLEKWAKQVNESEVTASMIGDKKLSMKYGEDEFNLSVENPESLVDMAIDNRNFFNLFTNKEGQMDFNKWYKVAAYAQNPEKFEELLIKHGQSLGTESVVDDMKNRRQTTGRKSPDTDAGGLLKAFAERGRHT